jgi:hypothetical protein
MAFRVYCPICKRVARIESSNAMNKQLKQAYCSCSNPECGHTFVMNVEFSHTLSPSALSLTPELRDRMRRTAPMEQGTLFSEQAGG